MTHICELPTVGEAVWNGTERDSVWVEDSSGTSDWKFDPSDIDQDVDYHRERLAALLVAQEFVASERERSRLDCAGENARLGYFQAIHATLPAMAWEHLKPSQRVIWVAAAKAVLDGEH